MLKGTSSPKRPLGPRKMYRALDVIIELPKFAPVVSTPKVFLHATNHSTRDRYPSFSALAPAPNRIMISLDPLVIHRSQEPRTNILHRRKW